MIWLSWRQFRVQALTGLGLVSLVAIYLLYLGHGIRRAHEPAQVYGNTLLYLAGVFYLVPAILGAFWGAPLVARELETGTHRLVWNQSVSRRRWLLVKLAVVGLAAMLVSGAISALLTWAAAPVDTIAGDRFSTVVFGARNLVPVGYAVFAFVVGAVLGLFVRRTLVAMALTFLAVVALQFAVPNLVRPHLRAPERIAMPMTADAINNARGLGSITGAPVVKGLSVPNAWISSASELRTADGKPLSEAEFNACFTDAPKTGAPGTFGDTAVCLAALNVHVDIEYQPNDRYWSFQWLELTMYTLAGGLLVALATWRIHTHPA
jgi:ABC-type transport system involved in multi-copper enzyme maturation permease subunit